MMKIIETLKSKWAEYLLEMLVIIISIIGAFMLDNWNDARNKRADELHYLKNIKRDIMLNMEQIDDYIDDRNNKIESAKVILGHFEGTPIEDPIDFNSHLQNIYTWQRFFQINNTFQEMTYSGNLALISSDSIKNELLNLEKLYHVMKAEEDHFRFDSETALFEPGFRTQDINRFVGKYLYDLTDGGMGQDALLKPEEFSVILNDLKQKNGFVMALLEFSVMNEQMIAMKTTSEKIVSHIDNEIKSD
ncbi:MAG: hypothetical protein JXR07_05790 [Reichenbachiella sp.]